MRKIKHWAGYGCVMAEKVKDNTCSLHVHIEGNHECGLSRPDWDGETPYRWLVHRFDKSAPSYYDRNANISVRHENGYTDRKGPYGLYVETCDYYFDY